MMSQVLNCSLTQLLFGSYLDETLYLDFCTNDMWGQGLGEGEKNAMVWMFVFP